MGKVQLFFMQYYIISNTKVSETQMLFQITDKKYSFFLSKMQFTFRINKIPNALKITIDTRKWYFMIL
jgi:hypothetical protein